SPGVFFYYTQFTVKATSDVVLIDQVATKAGYEFGVLQAPATSQIQMFDASCNSLALPTVTFLNSNTDVQLTGWSSPGTYIVSVKYDTSTIKNKTDPGTYTDSVSTKINGGLSDAGSDSLTVQKKALTLAAPAATAPTTDVLSQKQLSGAVDRAFAYWRGE